MLSWEIRTTTLTAASIEKLYKRKTNGPPGPPGGPVNGSDKMSLLFRSTTIGVRALITAPLIILASVLMFFGCNGAPTDPDAPTTAYVTQTYIVSDLNLNRSFVRARFLRADTTVPSGPVAFDTATIGFVAQNTLFQQEFFSANSITSGSHEVSLMDTSTVISNLNIIMPDTIGIFLADTTPYSGAGNLVITIDASSSNATGMIVATVKASEAYTGVGYAEFVLFGSALANIPPSVFRDPITNALDTGLYYVFVYAYTGAPRLDVITSDLPTALPDTGFGPNIAEALLSGNSGALLISAHDSVFVQTL